MSALLYTFATAYTMCAEQQLNTQNQIDHAQIYCHEDYTIAMNYSDLNGEWLVRQAWFLAARYGPAP